MSARVRLGCSGRLERRSAAGAGSSVAHGMFDKLLVQDPRSFEQWACLKDMACEASNLWKKDKIRSKDFG